jgi:preprotein translocase subunit YajC
VNITDKVKHAPDGSYQIGIVIGTFLPFVILVGIAYWMYYRAKNRNDNE